MKRYRMFMLAFLLLGLARVDVVAQKVNAGKNVERNLKGETGKGSAEAPQWAEMRPEAKPYTRWWWLGSAVDEAGLRYNLSEYAKAGIGGVEITPIYGVQGNDAKDIPYLSARWMEALQQTQEISRELGIEVNMATGTGWPFGGPNVPLDEAAAKLKVENGKFLTDRTKQKVKRAAPGGEGWVVDHFDRQSVEHYLSVFDRAFEQTGTPYPHTFFNDSYEVYNADWTPRMLEEFRARRGYDLEAEQADFLASAAADATDRQRRILSDYRETLSELLYENFTTVWTDWAHGRGAVTRNQAHGSPANLIDLYAAVDIPECEGFGLSDFGIKGLRTDPGFTKKNDSDLSMLKYASSGAHLSGQRFTSSETFTWLTEHFRTSFSQCKPDFDLMMVAGVNHVFFHGSCYTPEDDPWPGWKFYATVDMSPTNNLWRDAPAFFKYIERTQAFMQDGEPDNDILVYLPFHDMIYAGAGRLLQFDIHGMAKRAPEFIASINEIIRQGFDCDYISDRYLMSDELCFRYDAVLVPNVRFMPLATLRQLLHLARQGANIIFIGSMPQSAPGLKGLDVQAEFDDVKKDLEKLATVTDDYAVLSRFAEPENMRTVEGLSCIRRVKGDEHIYFVSNLQGRDVDAWVTMGKTAQSATFYNPMNGEITAAALRNIDGKTQVKMQLLSGESIVLVTSANPAKYAGTIMPHKYLASEPTKSMELTDWTLRFIAAAPTPIGKTYKMQRPTSWTELGDSVLCETMATGLYTTTLRLKKDAGQDVAGSRKSKATSKAQAVVLDLGDVRETARVRINGKEIATLFAVPYRLDITEHLRKGKNTIEVEVSNLAANRISRLDRDGVEWRKFKEINVVDLNYKNTRYDKWTPVPSGLCSRVQVHFYDVEE